jgi:hypothetical protein
MDNRLGNTQLKSKFEFYEWFIECEQEFQSADMTIAEDGGLFVTYKSPSLDFNLIDQKTSSDDYDHNVVALFEEDGCVSCVVSMDRRFVTIGQLKNESEYKPELASD